MIYLMIISILFHTKTFFMIIIYIVPVWKLGKLYIRINLILDLAEIDK